VKKEWAVLLDGKVFNTFDTREAAEELMAYITKKNRERKMFGGTPWASGKRTLACRDVSPWRKEPRGTYRVGCGHYYHDGRKGLCDVIQGVGMECVGRHRCTIYVPKKGGEA
jgi:hypothetical protein